MEPFHHSTMGTGFPPPDSHKSENEFPSMNGPIREEFCTSDSSLLLIFKYSGLTEKKKKFSF